MTSSDFTVEHTHARSQKQTLTRMLSHTFHWEMLVYKTVKKEKKRNLLLCLISQSMPGLGD